MGKFVAALGKVVVVAVAAAAFGAAPASAQDDLPETREGYEVISPAAFRKLPADTRDGQRYTIMYVKFSKLFGSELKLSGGSLDGHPLRSVLSGLLVVDAKRSRERLIHNLKGNRDSDGKSLTPKKSNIQLFGVGRRTPNGYVLSVNRVHRLGAVADYFVGLAASLVDGDSQGRLDVVAQIEETVKYHPEDQEAVAPLLTRLQQEARDAELGRLPELPGGVDEYLRFAKRHREITILGKVWNHPEVSAEDKAAAGKVLSEDLNAVLYVGTWLPYAELKKRLGFWKDGSEWVPNGTRLLKESTQAEKKRRTSFEIGSGQIDRQLLEVAMRNGDVLAGMSKDMVAAARGSFPVTVDRFREKIGEGVLVWERWEMEDGYQIFFCNKVSFHKLKPGEEDKK